MRVPVGGPNNVKKCLSRVKGVGIRQKEQGKEFLFILNQLFYEDQERKNLFSLGD